MNDNCDVQKSIQCEGGLLLASYNLWCEDHDVSEPFSDKAFYARLTAMGYANKRTNKVRYREGIDLKGDKRTEAKQRMAEKAAEAGAGG